jgi:hypothetical protein
MRRLLTIGLVSLFVFVMPPSSGAQSGPDLEGQPSSLHQGAMASYWVWHDADGYHLRTTTAHDRRVFSGRIEFSGGSGWAKACQLGPNDELRLTNQGITFHLSNQRNLKGFDFRMDYPSQATLSLELDDVGSQRMAEHVFMGSNNAHPNANPFKIAAVQEQFLAPGATRTVAQPPFRRPGVGISREEFASLDFVSAPTGAEILIDGNFVGNAPSRLRVPVGRHTITLRLSGYRTWTQTIQVAPGSEATIQKTLNRM